MTQDENNQNSDIIEWEQKGEHKEHLNVLEFKREKRKGELAELEQTIERVQQQQVSIKAVEQIEDKKTIADLKAQIELLVTELSAVKAELAQYKSARSQLRTADRAQENDRPCSRLCRYEDIFLAIPVEIC